MKRGLFTFAIALLAVLVSCTSRPDSIGGVVLDEDGNPLAGAVVRIKATELETVSDQDGHFELTGPVYGESLFITAWVPGYFIHGVDSVQAGAKDVEIVLEKHADSDHPDYEFVSAFSSAGLAGNCQNCHAEADETAALPFTEWKQDAHALSAQNTRFLSMYLGQDLAGNQSPLTRKGYNRDYGSFPLRPDPTKPYYGPGYKLDFPDTAGNCAACHTPAASVNNPYSVNPTTVDGTAEEGVGCDFCHKVWGVRLDPASGLPTLNMPGTLSFEFRRPPEGHQFFAGPLDDVAPGEDTYSPLQQQSQFCAPCHFGVFWDTVIYNSFGEWLESPYSDPENGKACQDCHMPPGKNDHFVRIDKGGVARNPETIFSHRMPGAADSDLLQNAVSIQADSHRKGDRIIVDVKIINDQSGHHVPTDSPLRQLILLVQATGADGEALAFLEGPVVPAWGGVGNQENGYYAGLPGKGYAKILGELWTEVSPTGAYWNPTRVLSDNRLGAFDSDESHYVFEAPDDPVKIEVTLLFRRAFKELMDQKGWDVPDIIMESDLLDIP